MTLSDIFPSLFPKDSDNTNDAAASESGSSLEKENRSKVEKVVKKSTETEKAAAFLQAFNQNNIEMMEMLTGAGGYKPSPEIMNNKGVTLKQWLAEQSKGIDDQARLMASGIERRIDNPSLALPGKVLAQVAAMQSDLGQWMGGMGITSNSLALPPPPRQMSLGMAA